MVKKTKPEDVKQAAKQLADLIASVDVDYRGDLMYWTGELLFEQDQHWTSRWLKSTAMDYGVSKRVVDHIKIQKQQNPKFIPT